MEISSTTTLRRVPRRDGGSTRSRTGPAESTRSVAGNSSHTRCESRPRFRCGGWMARPPSPRRSPTVAWPPTDSGRTESWSSTAPGSPDEDGFGGWTLWDVDEDEPVGEPAEEIRWLTDDIYWRWDGEGSIHDLRTGATTTIDERLTKRADGADQNYYVASGGYGPHAFVVAASGHRGFRSRHRRAGRRTLRSSAPGSFIGAVGERTRRYRRGGAHAVERCRARHRHDRVRPRDGRRCPAAVLKVTTSRSPRSRATSSARARLV